MSEEEKETIRDIKNIIEEVRENEEQGSPTYLLTRDTDCLKKGLELIDKQQKVIEKIKDYCIKNSNGELNELFSNIIETNTHVLIKDNLRITYEGTKEDTSQGKRQIFKVEKFII